MNKLIMICPLSSQPRFHKRSQSLNKYFELKIFAFKRRVYEGNQFDANLNYTDLGYINDGQYLSRIAKIITTAWLIRKEVTPDTYFYALSVDCLIIAKLAGIKRGYLEIGDLRIIDQKNHLLKLLDNLLIRSVRKVIITSPYFFTRYYQGVGFSADKFSVIENRLPAGIERLNGSLLEEGKIIRIGLIGLLRYEQPIKALIALVHKHPEKFSLECFGDGPCKNLLLEAAEKSGSVSYHGEFKCPDDLKRIYSSVDLSFAVYDKTSQNVRLALPNKLYESTFFGVPILCSMDTALAQEVKKLQIGISVDTASFEDKLISLNASKINRYIENCNKIKTDDLIDNSDKIIQELIK